MDDALCEKLSTIVGSKYVCREDFALEAYSCDEGPFPGIKPGVVVRPGTLEEICDIVRLANSTHTPVFPRGGGMSVFGFPRGSPGRTIVIDLTRIDRILEINQENMTITAECGVTLSELSTVVEKRGFHVHTVMVPFYTATLGGLLSGVAGGGIDTDWMSVGWTGDHVLSLKVVLPNGDVLKTGGASGTNIRCKNVVDRQLGAPDVTGMFIGDDGIFGVKVEATLKMYPLPKISRSGNFFFDASEGFWKSFYDLMALDPSPYYHMEAVSQEDVYRWCGERGWIIVYVVKGNSNEEVDSKVKKIEDVCRMAGGKVGPKLTDGMGAGIENEEAREMGRNYLKGRHLIFVSPIVPKDQIRSFYERLQLFDQKIRSEVEKHGMTRETHLLPLLHHACLVGNDMYYDASSSDTVEAAAKIAQDQWRFAIDNGAFIDAQQGNLTGVIASKWSPEFQRFMLSLKRTIDPNNIMNPGLWNL